ncbi:MAG: sigma 54-interacting transcriptional regulator [Pirellulales bacterium]
MSRTRSMGAAWLRLLAQSTTPIYALDDQRRIVYANPALSQWLQIDVDMLLEQRCDYHSPPASLPLSSTDAATADPRLAALVAALCPPPEALTGQRTTFRVHAPLPQGGETTRSADLVPLAGSAGDRAALAVFVAMDELPASDSLQRADATAEALHRRLQAARRAWWGRFHLDRLLGESSAMQRVREQTRWAAESQVRAVVVGPTGSGREFIARAIHRGTQTTIGPLVVWECSLLDGDLLRRSLDALARLRPDASATPPAILMRDVDQLSLEAQQTLADQVRAWRQPPRTLCTSSASLTELVREGKFRDDLAAWLSTCELVVPPLERRAEDIPWLAQAFLEEMNARGQRQWSGFSNEAMELLIAYRWPGQAAELDRVVQESCLRAEGPFVQAGDLPARLRQAADAARPARRTEEPLKLDAFLAEVEREVLRRALAMAKGNKAKAARALGISRPRLLRRVEQLGVTYP